MSEITLSTEELVFAAMVGSRRRIRAIAKGRTHRHAYDGSDNWTQDIESACSECAVAKATGVYWTDTPDPDKSDVGPYHVRATDRSNGSLILHHDDPDDGVFILACGKERTWKLSGWLRAAEGKHEDFWRDDVREPAFFAPQSVLCSMDDLPPVGQA